MNHSLIRLAPESGLQVHEGSNLSHGVARCLWDTSFDDQKKAHALQEYISHWSNTALPKILEQAFEDYCPPEQIWRINQLTLDLGEIDFELLPTELPKRLTACLSEQLERLRLDIHRSADHKLQNGLPDNLQINSHSQSLSDYIDYFLRHGIAPWWYTGNQSNLMILQQQIENAPQQIAAVIRDAGKDERVRKRIAWQYNSHLIKQIVKLLEPYHYGYIMEFSDQLIDLQAKTKEPKNDAIRFERQSWFWILTHLLVERGGLFNTMVFVESTLRQMARHYQIDYHILLPQLVNAAQNLEAKGHATPLFIQALLGLQQQSQKNAKQAVELEPDYWKLFTDNMRSGQQSSSLNLAELFHLLAEEDPARMTELLRKEGREAKVRQSLINRLNQNELSIVVSLLAPQDHLFILAHVRQAQEAFVRQETDEQLVWKVVLDYLLDHRGSYFNRRQFIDITLQKISQAQNISYLMLLDLLCGVSISDQHFELLTILSELRQLYQNREDERTPHIDTLYCQVLTAYLAKGETLKVIGNHYMAAPEQIFSTLLHQRPQQLALVIANTFQAGENNEVVYAKIKRLLNLTQAFDFRLVLRLFDARAESFVGNLIDQLNLRQRQHGLPSLKGFDLHHQLHAVALVALIQGLKSNFSVAGFLTAFFNELSVTHGIHHRTLMTEILQGLSQESAQPASPDHQALLQWLTTENPALIDHQAITPDEWPVAQAALLCYLREDKTGLKELGLAEDIPPASLFAKILPHHASLLLDALKNRSDRKALSQALLKQTDIPLLQQWFSALWPADAKLAPKYLDQWQTAIHQSGLWQGSSRVLQQKLHDIFWLLVLDHALIKNGALDQDNLEQLLADMVLLSSQQLHIGLTPLLERLNQKNYFDQIPLWQNTIDRYQSPDFIQNHLQAPLSVNVERLFIYPEAARPPTSLTENGVGAIQTVKETSQKHADEPSASRQETSATQITEQPFNQDARKDYLNHPLLYKICQYMLIHGRPPSWLMTAKPLNLQQMISDLLHSKPELLRQIIQNNPNKPELIFRLHQLVDYQSLLAALTRVKPELKSLLNMLGHFHHGLTQLRFATVDSSLPASLLWHKTLQAWLTNDWNNLSEQHIFSELSSELIRGHSISRELVEAEFKRNKQYFPDHCILSATPEKPDAQNNGYQPLQAQTDSAIAHRHNSATGQPNKQPTKQVVDLSAISGQPFNQDTRKNYLSHPWLYRICQYMLIHGRPPLWLMTAEPLNLQQMITDLLHSKPELLRQIIQNNPNKPELIFRLHQLVDYQSLLAALTQAKPELKVLLSMLGHFYHGLTQLRFATIDSSLPASLLWQKTLQAWLNNDWHNLSEQSIFSALSGELIRKYAISRELVEKEFKRNKQYFPSNCRLSITPEKSNTQNNEPHHLQSQADSLIARRHSSTPHPSIKPTVFSNNQPTGSVMPIQINNAGLVLLQGFITPYFNRAALIENNAFKNEQARHAAVHHLQYLATGLTATEEQHLVLNKLICGLSVSDPIESGIELKPEDKQTADGLIEAVIGYWPAIGSSSVEGFRGNWLVRNGLLRQEDDRWDLIVEKRPYDLLLQKAPFSYHLINLSWMSKPIYITWPS